MPDEKDTVGRFAEWYGKAKHPGVKPTARGQRRWKIGTSAATEKRRRHPRRIPALELPDPIDDSPRETSDE